MTRHTISNRSTRWPIATALLVVVLLGWTIPITAQEVPSDLKAAILFKVLVHDRNLEQRSGSALAIGLFYDEENRASRKCRKEMSKALGDLTSKSVNGLPIQLSEFAYTGTDSLDQAMKSKKVNVAFMCTGLESKIGEVTAFSRNNRLVTLADTEEMVKNGIAIGVGPKGRTAKIVINQKAAEAEGLDLDPRILLVAEVVN